MMRPIHTPWMKSIWKTQAPRMLHYRYNRLQHADEIRQLILHPGAPADPIRCRLEHVRLSDKPPYDALSYAWGDRSKSRTVYFENRSIPVTESLFSALRRLRYQDRNRVLWADAICINQDRFHEKNHQVALMGKIYSEAQQTLVWLGEESDEVSRGAFDFASRLDSFLSNNLHGYRDRQSEFSRLPIPSEVASRLRTTWIPELYERLGPLFNKPWFGRLWVVQEVILARHVELILGRYSCLFTTIRKPISALINLDLLRTKRPVWFNFDAACNCSAMGVIKDEWVSNEGNDGIVLLESFWRTHRLRTADVKDKLYGLFGLGGSTGLKADYSLSSKEVYINFALWCLRRVPDLKSLSYAGYSAATRRGLPSWVPSPYARVRKPLYSHFRSPGSQPYDKNRGQRERTWYIIGNHRLHLKGKLIDSLRQVSRAKPRTIGADLKKMLVRAENMARQNRIPWTDRRYREFCQAMTFELDFQDKRLGPEETDPFDRYYKLIKASSYEAKEAREESSVQEARYALERFYWNWGWGRRFCVTWNDRFSWVPYEAKENDQICIIQGARIPYVIREQGNGQFTLVGECYIHGFMDGQALNLPGFAWKDICLI